MHGSASRLVAALKLAAAPGDIIRKAQEGFYGDFTSPLAAPITQLVADLRRAGLSDLALRAMEGEFDG